jgi:hypothetical protein
MNLDQVRKILKKECDEAGSQAAWAYRHSLSASYVSDVLQERREPGPSLLTALKLVRLVSYKRVK